MRRTTAWFLVLLATTVLLGSAFVAVVALVRQPLPQRAGVVLQLDLAGAWPETDPNAAMNALFGRRVRGLHDLIGAIESAARDPKVLGIHARIGSLDVGWAKAQEIRAALVRFRDSGKELHAFLEGGGDGAYYVASASQKIRMLEAGTLWLDGIRAEVDFYGGTLDKVGVVADIEQIAEFKNAADVMKRSDMTASHREAVESMLDGLHDEFVGDVAASLGRSVDEVRAIVAAGPYTARAALDAGLIDAVGYEDEALGELEVSLEGQSFELVDLDSYLEGRTGSVRGPKIGVVFCVGTIVPGRSGNSMLSGEAMGAETIAEAIETAVEDDGMEALILRVDSPGGSPTASDIIWRAAQRARDEHGVPVIVSMGDVAASGGYWISMGADHVVASPATLTGSIGIYGGKYVTGELQKKIGLNTVVIERGRNAGIASSLEQYSEEQRRWLREDLGSVYAMFLEKTAEGRGFESPEAVDAVARGRVWTGRQALEKGLVDELGGLREAVAATRGFLGLDADAPVQLRTYPRPPTFFEVLRDSGPAGALGQTLAEALGQRLATTLPAEVLRLRSVQQVAALLSREGVLAYMPYHVRAD